MASQRVARCRASTQSARTLGSKGRLIQVRRVSLQITAAKASYTARNSIVRTRNLVYGTVFILTSAGAYYYATDTRSSVYQYILPPLIRRVYPDSEDGHNAMIKLLAKFHPLNLGPRERAPGPSFSEEIPELTTEVWEHDLNSPIAISAGLDKQGEAIDALFALGPSVLEIGAVTPKPQEGNPKPRAFRIVSKDAVVNRYGCNSDGVDAIAIRLRRRLRDFAYTAGFGAGEKAEQKVLDGEAGVPPGSLTEGKLLAVQVAKNKDTDEKDIEAVTRDYREAVRRLARYADVITVNVSSPNTAGLRELQKGASLRKILGGVVEECRDVRRKTRVRVMVKVSPDEDSDSQIRDVCQAVRASGVDGIIVANTTTKRPVSAEESYLMTNKERRELQETGGFSGPQLFEKTISLVGRYREWLDRLPGAEGKVIWASGGITNGQQVLQTMGAGADLAMIYTALTYSGAGTITRMKNEIRTEITDGLKAEAVERSRSKPKTEVELASPQIEAVV